MRRLVTYLLLVFIFWGYPPSAAQEQTKEHQRIISLLPSSTETLFALGLGDRVVGVTEYCRYPPPAREKEIVGGLIDVNYEIVYDLNPDLVIMLKNEDHKQSRFEAMGLDVLLVDTRGVSKILNSMRLIGETLNRRPQAGRLIRTIEDKIKDIKERTQDLSKPRVLITFLRPLGEGQISEVYIAGNNSYFNDFITIAGGVNAYQGSQLITSPVVSPEGILEINPDIIIEIMTRIHETGHSEEEVLKDWDMLSVLDAYKNKRIHILTQPFIGIPGPRLPQTLDKVARIIHPEVDWDQP